MMIHSFLHGAVSLDFILSFVAYYHVKYTVQYGNSQDGALIQDFQFDFLGCNNTRGAINFVKR
jgi:hypothetical protein